MVCVMCEKESVENWFGSFCKECRQIKNLGNVYGFPRILDLLKKCCIRDENQLEKKIDNHKQAHSDLSYTKPSNIRLTRSSVSKPSKATTD
mgnify:FL=1